MADGSVREAATTETAYVASVGMKDDFYLEFNIPGFVVPPETMADYARQMASWGRAALYCARYRGAQDVDLPGTLDNALAAADFLLQMSAELEKAAAKLPGGRGHG
jgi:hypothetical protein